MARRSIVANGKHNDECRWTGPPVVRAGTHGQQIDRCCWEVVERQGPADRRDVGEERCDRETFVLCWAPADKRDGGQDADGRSRTCVMNLFFPPKNMAGDVRVP